MISRGINHQLNTLERVQNDHSLDARAIIDLEKLIAPHLIFLADVAGAEAPYLARECLLTAFSLHPTPATLRRIRQAALDTGRIQQPSTCPTHEAYVQPVGGVAPIQCPTCPALIKPPSTETDALTGIRLITQFDYDHKAVPCMLLHNELHLCSRISGGIVSLLSRPRLKSLSWMLEWDSLKAVCENLLDARTKYEVATLQVHGANDRLQNLDIDYELYEHLPDQDYGTWEKGYEDLDSQNEDDEEEYVAAPVPARTVSHATRKSLRIQRRLSTNSIAVAPKRLRPRRDSHTLSTATRLELLGATSDETPSEFESDSADEAKEVKRAQDDNDKSRKQREGKSRRAALRRALLSLEKTRRPDKRKGKPITSDGQPAKIRKRRESVRAPMHARRPAASKTTSTSTGVVVLDGRMETAESIAPHPNGTAQASVNAVNQPSIVSIEAPLVNKPGKIRKRRESLRTPVGAKNSTVTKIMRSLKTSGIDTMSLNLPTRANPTIQAAGPSGHQPAAHLPIASQAHLPIASQAPNQPTLPNGNLPNYQAPQGATVWTQWRNDLSNWERLGNLRRRFEYLQTMINNELVQAAERYRSHSKHKDFLLKISLFHLTVHLKR